MHTTRIEINLYSEYKNLGRNGQNFQSVQLGQSGKNPTNYFWINFLAIFVSCRLKRAKWAKCDQISFFYTTWKTLLISKYKNCSYPRMTQPWAIVLATKPIFFAIDFWLSQCESEIISLNFTKEQKWKNRWFLYFCCIS